MTKTKSARSKRETEEAVKPIDWIDKAFREGFEAGGKWGLSQGFDAGFRDGYFAGIGGATKEMHKAGAKSANALRSDWHQSALAWAKVRLANDPPPTAKKLRGEILDMCNDHPDRANRRKITDAAVAQLLARNRKQISEGVTKLRAEGVAFPEFVSSRNRRVTTQA